MELKNLYRYVTTVGELKEILENFNDDVPIDFDSSPTTHDMPDVHLGCDIHHVTGRDQEILEFHYWEEDDMAYVREIGEEGQKLFDMSYEQWIKNHPKRR